jgi:excisionase family DNA binding protein
MKRQTLRPCEAASMLGVDIRTLKRWEDRGLLHVHRTAGGQRRYNADEVLGLARNPPKTRGKKPGQVGTVHEIF